MLKKKWNEHLILAGLLTISFSTMQAKADDLAEPFPGSLFPSDNSSAPSTSKPAPDQSAIKQAAQQRIQHANDSMRNQIQKVASWLQEFSLRNQNRFPGVYGTSDTIERACEVQLTELVGPNPYGSGSDGSVAAQELNGLSPGLSYYYNADGTPATGSPLANDEWTSELSADSAHRINLQMDQSSSAATLDSYKSDPPLNWQAAPGTITAAGNGQGFFYVWGAGHDGKPVRDYNGKVYIVKANTGGAGNQEAGY